MNFRFQPKQYNYFYDLMKKSIKFDHVAVFKRNEYRIHFWYISKDEDINLLRNAELTEKIWKIEKYTFFLVIIKSR